METEVIDESGDFEWRKVPPGILGKPARAVVGWDESAVLDFMRMTADRPVTFLAGCTIVDRAEYERVAAIREAADAE